MPRLLIPILALAAICSIAHADVIHLTDGTIRHGRIVEENDKEVVVDFGVGSISLVTRIPREKIVRIEKKASPQEALMSGYVGRRAKAERGTADDWFALGVWCRRQRVLKEKALESFRQAILLAPDHRGAHAALGHVKLNERWMTPRQAIAMLAPGFGEVGEFKAREVEAQRDAEVARTELLEAQAKAKKLEAQVEELERENRALRRRVAVPPPLPPPPRVIYRPIIIYRDRPRPHPRPHPKKDEDAKRK